MGDLLADAVRAAESGLDSLERLKKHLATFFETAGLFRAHLFPEAAELIRPRRSGEMPTEFPFPTDLKIEHPCPTCGGPLRTFRLIPNIQSRRDYEEVEIGQCKTLLFGCSHCEAQKLAVLVYVAADAGQRVQTLVKAGQWPSSRPAPPPELRAGLGAAVDLYAAGLMVERFGFGIAAFAYYRRVTEEVVGSLMTELRGFAEETGAVDLVAAIDKVAGEQQASKRIEAIKDLVPAALRPGGQNPIGTLYSTLSEGLHGRSDLECLHLAEHLRLALDFLLTTLAQRSASKNQYLAAMKKLQGARTKAGKKKS